MNLTNSDIKKLEYISPPESKEAFKVTHAAQYYWDNEPKGFGIRVYPSGRKSYVLSYRNDNNTKRFYTIGHFPDLSIKQARDIAKEKLYEVSKGLDPQTTKHDKKQEMTFAALAIQYLEYSKQHKRSFKDDDQRLRDHLTPALGKYKLSEITLIILQKHMKKLCENLSPSTVNRCIALTKHMFTMAMRWEIINASPANHLQMFKEPPSYDIVLTPHQCQSILQACKKEPNIYAAALFQLALLTGRRIGEIRNIQWQDVAFYQDDNNNEHIRLTIRNTKAGEQQHVFLNDMAKTILIGLPKIVGTPYVISGEITGKPLQTYSKAWRRVLIAAEVPYFKPHGLRHNYVSTMVAAGESLDIVGHLVGHKNSATTKKYAHHRPEWLQKSSQRFGEVINMTDAKKLINNNTL